MQRWEANLLLALASVKREGKIVPLLSEQGQCVISCNKKYFEQRWTLQGYSLGKEWRAKREEILRNDAEIPDLFAPWHVKKSGRSVPLPTQTAPCFSPQGRHLCAKKRRAVSALFQLKTEKEKRGNVKYMFLGYQRTASSQRYEKNVFLAC